MSQRSITVSCPVRETFRVAQVAGIFDLKLETKTSATFDVDVPAGGELLDGQPWKIGCIVGPSGSGKSTVARDAYGAAFYEGGKRWPKDQAVIDGFGNIDVRDITHALTAVGFSSPPSWVKPYHVLSNGERFRCDLARALLIGGNLVAYDEFTSVVDRTVARIGSAAVAKAIRTGKIGRQFVAVTCHYDIVDWLAPDWVLDMATGRLARGCLRRPEIRLDVALVHRTAWELFRRHHYLNTSLSYSAECFAAFWRGTPVAFSAWMHRMTRNRIQGDRREHRTVVLPDYQGIGIGNRLSELVASIYRATGRRAFSTTSHPAMIRYRSASPLWNRERLGMASVTGGTGLLAKAAASSCDRITGGFEYVGPPHDRERAKAILAGVPRIFGDGNRDDEILRVIAAYRGATASLIARKIGIETPLAKRLLDLLVAQRRIEVDGETRRGDRVGYRLAPDASADAAPDEN